MIRFLSIGLYAACCAAQSPAGGVAGAGGGADLERVQRALPLRELVAAVHSARPPKLSNFLGSLEGDDARALLEQHDGRREFSPDLVAELCRIALGDAAEEEGWSLTTLGATALLAGPAEHVQRCEDLVRYLTRAVASPIRVEVATYELPDDAAFAAGGIVDVASLASLGWRRTWHASGAVRSGGQLGLGRESARRYVQDVDVEVAQDSDIGDPKVLPLFEGVRVVVEPHATTRGGSVVVLCQLAVAELRDVGNRSTGVHDHPSIDVPRLAGVSGACSAVLRSGQAMVFAATGERAGGCRVAVVVQATAEPADTSGQGGFRAFPISALTTPSLRRGIVVPGRGGAESSYFVDAPIPLGISAEGVEGLGLVDRDTIQEMVLDVLADRVDEDGVAVELAGGFLLVRGSADDHRRVESALARAEAQWLRNGVVRAQTTSRPADGSGTAAQLSTHHYLAYPALLERPHFGLRGVETTAIVDFDVEIAQESAVSNPVVAPVFEGVICSGTAFATVDGVAGDFAVELVAAAEPRRRAAETKNGGDLYLTTTTRAPFSLRGPLEPGQTQVLGDGPIVERDGRSFVMEQALTIDVAR